MIEFSFGHKEHWRKITSVLDGYVVGGDKSDYANDQIQLSYSMQYNAAAELLFAGPTVHAEFHGINTSGLEGIHPGSGILLKKTVELLS